MLCLPLPERFRNGDWIFRGQGEDLPLLPTAYRKDRMRAAKKRAWDQWSYWMQVRAELKLIRRFTKLPTELAWRFRRIRTMCEFSSTILTMTVKIL